MMTIPFNLEDFDISNSAHSGLSIINPNTFVAPVNGIYHFDMHTLWSGTPGTDLFFWIDKNGNPVANYDDNMPAGFSTHNINFGTTIRLNAGDKVKMMTGIVDNDNQQVLSASLSGFLVFKL
jgi:hypothetical protein